MEPQKNKGLEDFIEQAMNIDDDFIQRGTIHGDPKGVIIIDEMDTLNHSPEVISALLNLNGQTQIVSGSTSERAQHLLDMFDELKEDKTDSQ